MVKNREPIGDHFIETENKIEIKMQTNFNKYNIKFQIGMKMVF